MFVSNIERAINLPKFSVMCNKLLHDFIIDIILVTLGVITVIKVTTKW